MNDLKIVIKNWLNEVDKLKVDGDKIFIDPKGEEVLVQILEAEKQLELIKDELKLKLETKALSINPNFNSIQGDRIKVFYREYGSKYYVDESQSDLIPEGFTEKKTSYIINTKAVDDWIDQKSVMPTGIKEVERKKTISFSLKDEK